MKPTTRSDTALQERRRMANVSEQVSTLANMAANNEGDSTSPGGAGPKDSTCAILAAIESQGRDLKKMLDETRLSISSRLEKIETTLSTLQSDQNKMKKQVSDIESVANGHDGRLSNLEKSHGKLLADYNSLRAKVNDLEGRSRRLNLKFVGIKEGEEKGRPTDFVSELIPQLLGRDNFNKPVKVDRAHRILKPKPAEGEKARTIIAKMHHDRDKDRILRLSREQGQLFYKGSRVFIFPDYTAEVMTQRRAFADVMKTLREAGVKYSLRFPAKLRIEHNSTVKTYDTPGEAERFAETVI